jgi:hypothetical protein
MSSATELQAELAQQRKDLRRWVLIVGIVSFGIDVIGIEVYGMLKGMLSLPVDMMTPSRRDWLLLCSGGLLAYFVAMWWYARRRPVLACVLAIAGYWSIHVAVAVAARSPAMLVFGIVVELGMTVGLIIVIRSVRRTERMLRALDDIGEVFADEARNAGNASSQ